LKEKDRQQESRPEIMVVDDDRNLCESLEMILNEVGYGVRAR
jgi:FixJ family two-component response regulator